MFFLGVLYKHQEQPKGQEKKQQSHREGESETMTKGGTRKGIQLDEREVAVRKEERGTKDFFVGVFGFHWFRVSLRSVSCF